MNAPKLIKSNQSPFHSSKTPKNATKPEPLATSGLAHSNTRILLKALVQSSIKQRGIDPEEIRKEEPPKRITNKVSLEIVACRVVVYWLLDNLVIFFMSVQQSQFK